MYFPSSTLKDIFAILTERNYDILRIWFQETPSRSSISCSMPFWCFPWYLIFPWHFQDCAIKFNELGVWGLESAGRKFRAPFDETSPEQEEFFLQLLSRNLVLPKMQNFLKIYFKNCPFSDVLGPIFATEYSSCRIFVDLQNHLVVFSKTWQIWQTFCESSGIEIFFPSSPARTQVMHSTHHTTPHHTQTWGMMK